jgi:hypothetical protein
LTQKGKPVRRKRNGAGAFFDDKAGCSSGSENEWNEEEETNVYDSGDLHEGSEDEEQPIHNMRSHPGSNWIKWGTLQRSGRQMFKHVQKADVDGRGEQAYLSLEDGGIRNMLILIHQSNDTALEWVKPRIKLINTYLEADVGNILAQDIIDTLAENFEVVALKPCRGEINYEQIAGMEDLDDKMREEILACEEYTTYFCRE